VSSSGRCAGRPFPSITPMPSIHPMLILPPTVPAARVPPCHSCCPSVQRYMDEQRPCAMLALSGPGGTGSADGQAAVRRNEAIQMLCLPTCLLQGCRSSVQQDLARVNNRTRSAMGTQSLVSSAARLRLPRGRNCRKSAKTSAPPQRSAHAETAVDIRQGRDRSTGSIHSKEVEWLGQSRCAPAVRRTF
jgi:hypothetical protein